LAAAQTGTGKTAGFRPWFSGLSRLCGWKAGAVAATMLVWRIF
jgi:hypothetical protein